MNDLIKKFKDILLEDHVTYGGTVSKLEANYTDHGIGKDKCEFCEHFIPSHSCEIVEGFISPEGWCKFYDRTVLDEKWGTQTVVSPEEKGKYKGKSLAELRSAYNALKKSGPHKRSSPEFGRMRELAFAIRAKTGWGKV